MGLFSSVLHIHDVDRDRFLAALDETLRDAKFERVDSSPIKSASPKQPERSDNDLHFYVSPLNGRWVTLIEGHFGVRGAPPLAEIGNSLSRRLSCYALTLVVHDDDVMFYNLDHRGASLDGYNSCPQYFEREKLSDSAIAQQRHTPECFAPLLPEGAALSELQDLLNRGWWNAYHRGQLDEHGVPRGKGDRFVFEGDRMIAVGTLLNLHGASGQYPYAAWAGASTIDWKSFIELRYRYHK